LSLIYLGYPNIFGGVSFVGSAIANCRKPGVNDVISPYVTLPLTQYPCFRRHYIGYIMVVGEA
jgi:hypothetical protein